jgi:primase-polymerase (primpol)-like protein
MSPSEYIIAHADAIPPELQRLPHWVNWDYVPVDKRWTKVLQNARTRQRASSTNPDTWSTFDRTLKTNPDRIGFVLTDSGFTVIDLDHCRDPDTGVIAEWAWVIIRRLDSYTEVSVSGTGVHIIVRGQLPPGRRRVGQIETYDSGRYITVTGAVVDGYGSIRVDDGILAAWHADTFPAKAPTAPPTPTVECRLDDDVLLERIRNSKNGAAFIDLFDHEGASKYGGNKSSRDFALMSYLRFWTQGNTDQMERLFSQSVPGKREKWRTRADYRQKTIENALDGDHRDPNHGQTTARLTIGRTPPPVFEPGATCDERLKIALETIELQAAEITAAKETIAIRERVIERERELRIAAEERANRLGFERSQIMQIFRNSDLGAGEKITHFFTTVDLGARIANGEEQAPQGFRLPAIRIAEQTGQSVQSVRKHWNKLTERGVLDKRNVRERTETDAVDPETGEISTATGMRDVSHIHVPENNIIHLIVPAASYERPEQKTGHGGKRTPKPICELHPEAGTLTRTVIECASCHQELSRSAGAYEAPAESSGINLIGEPPVSNTLLRATKLIGETGRPSAIKMKGELPPNDARPEPTGPPPNWEDERRLVYGQVYRGEVAS